MSNARVERRLAAILAADIVGYSRLIESDETSTLASIRAIRAETIDPTISEHRGRIVKLMGDGFLVEFGSVVDAVACAVAIQKAVVASQASVPISDRILFRIGINLGDVVVEGEDLLGDGVNIAARLETLADPGGVCIADSVQRQLAGKSNFGFHDAGEHTLKNISEPVRVWKWGEGPVPETAASAPAPSQSKPSIAVLPFDNLSGQPEETYFSDGITEDIITAVARFRSLFVIARNSSFAFRGKQGDLAEIGRKLGVEFLLEGSVRRAGDRVRITAQLIRAGTGVHIWAERYDRALDDIFQVQDEVARMIAATLVGRILDARLQQSFRQPTDSLAAYDCMLRGMAHFRGYAEDDNEKALAMFERAVELDPQYALAHAYVANAQISINGAAAAPKSILDSAYARALHALELDPQDSNCYRVMALVWLYRRDYAAAELHYRRALELNPNDADRRMGLGYILALRGQLEEALTWMNEAVQLNPLHPTWYHPRFGVAYYSQGKFTEAAQAFRQIPNGGYWSRSRLAACYAKLGRTEEADAQKEEILRLRPGFSIADFMRSDVLLERVEDRKLLEDGLIKAGLPR